MHSGMFWQEHSRSPTTLFFFIYVHWMQCCVCYKAKVLLACSWLETSSFCLVSQYKHSSSICVHWCLWEHFKSRYSSILGGGLSLACLVGLTRHKFQGLESFGQQQFPTCCFFLSPPNGPGGATVTACLLCAVSCQLLLVCVSVSLTLAFLVWWQCWRAECCRAGESYGDCREPSTVQDSRLVFEQEEGPQGWAVLTGCIQCPWHETQGWFGTAKEDQVWCISLVVVSFSLPLWILLSSFGIIAIF